MFEDNLKTIRDVFREVEVNGVTESRTRARPRTRSARRSSSRANAPAASCSRSAAAGRKRREYKSVKDVLGLARAVTLAGIREVLDRYPLSAGSAISVGPAEVT